MKPHPRLYLSPANPQQLRQRPKLPFLRDADAWVRQHADEMAQVDDVQYTTPSHNDLLLRARAMQCHVVTLLVRWAQSGEAKYRDAVVRHVRSMGQWTYWSWIAMRRGDSDPMAIYDLSYGENSATLALAYDWLHDTLSDEEQQMFLDIAVTRSLRPFLHATNPKSPARSWFKRPNSNWNTVCTGGAGMLALAMYEELPEAKIALRRTEQSFPPYMKHLDKSDGAWPEGIGYWNYGMRYAFMYLLSHERASGKPHPLLHRPATKATLAFPLAFSPAGQGCSFGDVNRWRPLPFHVAAANRLGEQEVARMLDDALLRNSQGAEGWPQAAELLVLHPGTPAPELKSRRGPVARRYCGQDWAILADRMPDPRLYASIRGGTTKVPHGHLDLLSFHAVIGDERMIVNLGPDEYLDTTFSGRRYDLPEMRPDYKNAILIGGVGIMRDTEVTMTDIKLPSAVGYRLDATAAMGNIRDAPVKLCARLFLLLRDNALLIVDRVQLQQPCRIESRMHTHAAVAAASGNKLKLAGERQRMAVTYAASVEAGFWQARTSPTTPGPGAHVLRWCTKGLHNDMTLATLLCPGATPGKLSVTQRGGVISIEAGGRNWQWRGRVDGQLNATTPKISLKK